MIYKEMPSDFDLQFDAASCLLENQGEILFLHRQDYKPQGNTWGVPTGKIDLGERTIDGMIRETYEETGIILLPDQVSYHGKVYFRYPDIDFGHHLYHTELSQRPEVILNPKEHKDYIWLPPKRALDLALIMDLDTQLIEFYGL